MSTVKLKDDFFFPESDAFEMRSLVGLGCKKVWRQFVHAPHSLSYECHLQEAKEQDTSKKIAATRRLTSHNTLPDHDVLLRARLA